MWKKQKWKAYSFCTTTAWCVFRAILCVRLKLFPCVVLCPSSHQILATPLSGLYYQQGCKAEPGVSPPGYPPIVAAVHWLPRTSSACAQQATHMRYFSHATAIWQIPQKTHQFFTESQQKLVAPPPLKYATDGSVPWWIKKQMLGRSTAARRSSIPTLINWVKILR